MLRIRAWNNNMNPAGSVAFFWTEFSGVQKQESLSDESWKVFEEV